MEIASTEYRIASSFYQFRGRVISVLQLCTPLRVYVTREEIPLLQNEYL